MNKRQLLCLAGAAFSAAAGWLFPRIVSGSGVSFILACLIAAFQEILMFGLPAALIILCEPFRLEEIKSWLRKPSSYDTGLTMMSAVSYTLAGALISAVAYALLSAFGLVLELPPTIIPETISELLVAAVTVSGITAICEELLFRHALVQLLGRRFSRKTAVILTSILFAALHFSLIGFPSLLLLSLLLHSLYARKGTLVLPIVFHAMYNFAILVINYSGALPGFGMILLSTGIFVFATRLLLKEENNEIHSAGL